MRHEWGSSMPWAEEQNATAKGTQEEVLTCRRSRVPFLGRERGGVVDKQEYLSLHTWNLRGLGVFGEGYGW